MSTCVMMRERKRIAMVAHNNKKEEFIECLKKHRKVLSQHELFGTGTTGSLVEKALNLPVTKFQSGPFGGDQQIGAMIASQQLDMLFFIIDPLDCHPHDADVLALLRIAQVWGIVCVTTIASVDFILVSPMMHETHTRSVNSSLPVLPDITKSEKQSVLPFSTERVPGIGDAPQHLLQRVPVVAPSGKKSIAQLRMHNNSLIKDKSQTRFPRILSKRQYPITQQTVLKDVN